MIISRIYGSKKKWRKIILNIFEKFEKEASK